MMKSIFVLLTGVILFSGMFVVGLNSSDVFAEKGGNDKQQAKGCENANKDKMKDKNKHCDSNTHGNGNDGSLPENSCDTDNSGSLTAEEIGIGSLLIIIIEETVSEGFENNLIDTLDEWDLLQVEIGPICIK